MQPLSPRLDEVKKRFVSRTSEDVHGGLFRLIREQRDSGEEYGLRPGEKAIDFALPDADGRSVRLFDELEGGPVVLVFYRGGWCPFCNLQLRAYRERLTEFEALGARVIAVSPQSPDRALAQRDKEELPFPLLSDPDGRTAASYRLLYEVPGYVRGLMEEGLRIDLAAVNDSERWLLPVPAVFLIDGFGIVRSVYANPDFMEREEPEKILALLLREL